MKIIGLCGGSGSGKGAVCDLFRQKGILCIDTDLVYRDLTSRSGSLLQELEREFGNEIISDENTLNRKALAKIVFSSVSSNENLKRLNEISHKYILDETRRMLRLEATDGARLSVVDAPVLFESGFDRECDLIVCVVADKDVRINRIIARDGITAEQAEERISSQMSDDELISRSDYVINNNDSLEELKDNVFALIDKLICK